MKYVVINVFFSTVLMVSRYIDIIVNTPLTSFPHFYQHVFKGFKEFERSRI